MNADDADAMSHGYDAMQFMKIRCYRQLMNYLPEEIAKDVLSRKNLNKKPITVHRTKALPQTIRRIY